MASRLIPSSSCALVAVASALVICIHWRVSVYLIPGGLRIPWTGHQVQSVLSPPRRSTGRAPGARLRINCSNTGLSAAGSWPAKLGIAQYSVESPTNPLGIVLPGAFVSTVRRIGPPS